MGPMCPLDYTARRSEIICTLRSQAFGSAVAAVTLLSL